MFPVWNDASTWNLRRCADDATGLPRRVRHRAPLQHRAEPVSAGWVQDDWRIGNNLTLNLGVRYDWDNNAQREKLTLMPFLPGNLPHDNNNVAPRIGRELRLNDRRSVRGGYGLFFAFAPNDGVQQSYSMVHRFEYQIANDGRPDFVTNCFGPGASGEGEFGGPKPTWDAVAGDGVRSQATCPDASGGRSTRKSTTPAGRTPYSHQASVGVQRQIGDTIVGRGELRLHGGTPRGRRTQREPHVQPGHGRELSLH